MMIQPSWTNARKFSVTRRRKFCSQAKRRSIFERSL